MVSEIHLPHRDPIRDHGSHDSTVPAILKRTGTVPVKLSTIVPRWSADRAGRHRRRTR